MRNKSLYFLKSKIAVLYSRLTSRVSEEVKLKKTLDEYHSMKYTGTSELPAQALQGMWQAYGSMHAAKTRGWFAIAATGVIGTALFGYRTILSDQKKEIKTKQEELNQLEEKNSRAEREIKEKEQQLQIREKIVHDSSDYIKNAISKEREYTASYSLVTKKLGASDSYVRKLCGESKVCLSEYTKALESEVQTNLEEAIDETNRASLGIN